MDIKQIHEFKRMRRFQPFSAVVAALKESEVLEVVNGDQVQRKTPLSDDVGTSFDPSNIRVVEDKAMPRSIYAKGFGEETKSTQYDIEDFFAPYGPINAVRLRRTSYDKWFKGSVFIEFETEELMKEFMALDPKPTWNGKELLIMTKKEYCDSKAEDIKAGRIQPNNEPYARHGKGDRRGGYKGNRGKGRDGHYDRDRRRNERERERDDDDDDRDEHVDADDWKRRRDDFQKNGFKDKKSSHKSSGKDSEADKQHEEDATAGTKDEDVTEDKTTSPSKKRARDEGDDETAEQSTKKGKAEEIDRDEEIRKAMPKVSNFHYRAVAPWVKTLEPYRKYF